MGFAPSQIKKMSFWEFSSAFSAWKQFHGIKSGNDSTATIERLRELGIE